MQSFCRGADFDAIRQAVVVAVEILVIGFAIAVAVLGLAFIGFITPFVSISDAVTV